MNLRKQVKIFIYIMLQPTNLGKGVVNKLIDPLAVSISKETKALHELFCFFIEKTCHYQEIAKDTL